MQLNQGGIEGPGSGTRRVLNQPYCHIVQAERRKEGRSKHQEQTGQIRHVMKFETRNLGTS